MFHEIGETIGSGFMAAALILIISMIAGLIFFILIGSIINKDVTQYHNLQMALAISIIATGMSLVSFSMYGINQEMHNSAHVAMASLLGNGIFLLTNVLLLYLGFGVISIGFANLCKAVFVNIYNMAAMRNLLKRETLEVIFRFKHFKSFLRIFSFAFVSRVISGFSTNMDIIILARFIPPGMITIFEINRRPIILTQSLVGRHAVALMPLISHAKGLGDEPAINNLIYKQFKFYSYAALFISFLFCLVYHDLITVWIGTGKYAGDTIMYLLVANFFFFLIGYFMSNMGYALGDIKMNSLVNIFKGLLLGFLLFFVARKYGIVGTLLASLGVILVTDFSYFTYRLYKIGHLQSYFRKKTVQLWSVIIPSGILLVWGSKVLVQHLFDEDQYLAKLMMNASTFTIVFFVLLLVADVEIRHTAWMLRGKFVQIPCFKLRKT